MLITSLIIGSGVFVGANQLQKKKTRHRLAQLKKNIQTRLDAEQAPTNSFVWANKHFKVANASLLCTLAGTIAPPLTIVGMGGLVYLTYPTWKRAYYDLTQKRRFTRIVVESVVLPGAIVSGHYIAAATTYWFLYFALRMVAKAKENTTHALEDVLLHQLPPVYLVKEGVEVETSLESLKPNDVIRVKQGDYLYVQGEVIEGSIQLACHTDALQIGDPFEDGCLITSGNALVRVEKVLQDFEPVHLDTSDSTELLSVDFVDRLALPHFLLGTVTGALKNARSGLAILWLPFDDALYTAGPLGVINYLDISLLKGILIKDGRTLEQLTKTNTWGIASDAIPQDEQVRKTIFQKFESQRCYINDPNHCLDAKTIAWLNEQGIEIDYSSELAFVEKLAQSEQPFAYVTNSTVSADIQRFAPVTISFSEITHVQRNHASVLLMEQRLSQLPELMDIAAKLKSNYKRTLAASLVPSAMIIGGVFVFHMTLTSTVFLYMTGMGLSIGNAMLPKLTERLENK